MKKLVGKIKWMDLSLAAVLSVGPVFIAYDCVRPYEPMNMMLMFAIWFGVIMLGLILANKMIVLVEWLNKKGGAKTNSRFVDSDLP